MEINDVLVAEYAVGTGMAGTVFLEGRAMLRALVGSFECAGFTTTYPASGSIPAGSLDIPTGRRVDVVDNSDGANDAYTAFLDTMIELSYDVDAVLVVAPDELLSDLTRAIEGHTVNLGCPSFAVALAADKLECSRILAQNGIPVPEIFENINDASNLPDRYVVKPRFGCASEGISINGKICEGSIAMEFIEGEHLSVSLVASKDSVLPLTLNKQYINIDFGGDGGISYDGGVVGYDSERKHEVFDAAKRAAVVLGCRGYVGIDIVLGDKPYIVDVNPRPTTSIIGMASVIDAELGQLIVDARSGRLPECVGNKGAYSFTKKDIM